ncbi:IS66 family insertion sequence element accessory protein TnpB [Bradyrhizobium sp. 151]|nr:IS66 family insertion sequence element accessory protein TnpB [Bradyrhizobium sp. 151]
MAAARVVDLDTTQPIDCLRGIDALAMLVSEAFGADPFEGELCIFRSKRRDRAKN